VEGAIVAQQNDARGKHDRKLKILESVSTGRGSKLAYTTLQLAIIKLRALTIIPLAFSLDEQRLHRILPAMFEILTLVADQEFNDARPKP
jgi:hypothetical protein